MFLFVSNDGDYWKEPEVTEEMVEQFANGEYTVIVDLNTRMHFQINSAGKEEWRHLPVKESSTEEEEGEGYEEEEEGSDSDGYGETVPDSDLED